MNQALLLRVFALTLFVGPAQSWAAPSRSLRVTTYKDFAEGQETGVLVSSQGEVQSGFSANRLALPSLSDDSVRSLATAADGTVLVGTGGDKPSILTYAKGTLRKLAQLDAATWVTALRALPPGGLDSAQRSGAPSVGGGQQGDVLAATAQDGRIFVVGRDGKVRTLATLKADHVWDLRYDEARKLVYAVTGPGKLWSVDAHGKTELIFDSGARQILALDQGEDGALYLGTADEAVLYRVDPRTKAVRALYDFSGNELRAVAHRGLTLYAAVNDMQRGTGAEAQQRGIRIVTPAAGTAPGSGGAHASTSSSGSEGRTGKGALYRIDPDGRVEQLHAISDGFFNALQVDSDNNLFAAASTPGGRGRVYWVRPDRTVLTALELKESDVLSLLNFGGPGLGRERLVGTGNSAALYQVGTTPPKDAHYLSKVFDGQFPANWGSVRWAGNGSLRIETRSGNLAKPDGTWSGWQAVGRSDNKSAKLGAAAEQIGKIASPQGRYLQVRVGFGSGATLQHFVVGYQALNQRPRVTEVLVGEDPLSGIARGPRPTGAARPPKQTVVKLRWKVENPDEDELSYHVYVRRQTSGTPGAPGGPGTGDGWIRVGGPDPLLKAELDWNTDSVPDGVYEARVVASDERANPQESALRHELVSPPFVVDNRRPELQGLKWQPGDGPFGLLVTGQAVDALSPLSDLSYALDGADFLPLAPRDGVLDEPAEEFALKLQGVGPGSHTLVIRAIDAADNIATAQLVVQNSPSQR